MLKRHALAFALVPVLALSSVACTKDRSTFAPAWKAAVQAKDGNAALALLDRATRDKIVSGLKKSQDKAAKDEAFKKIFAAVNAPVDTTRAPELLAGALIAAQMADGKADLTDDGKTTEIHVEDGNWKVAAEPIGFVDPDGAPLTLRLRLPGTPAREPPPGVTSFNIHVPWAGKTVDEIHDAQTKAVVSVAKYANLDDHYAVSAGRLINTIMDIGDPNAVDRQFEVDRDGGITPIYSFFDRATLSEQKKPRGKITFGAWK